MKAIRFLLLGTLLASSNGWGWLYTNTAAGRAIDLFTAKKFAVESRLYSDTVQSGSSIFDSDAPIYFLDASRAIDPLHHFLGFVDFVVCPEYSSNNLPWRMYGDGDRRDMFDMRALDSENSVWDMIDTNYKSLSRNLSYNVSNLWLTTTSLAANPSLAKNGEFCVARFAVPKHTNGGYFVSFGKQIVRIGANGSEASYVGQVKLRAYTVSVTNPLAVKAVLTGSQDGQFQDAQVVQDISAVRGPINRVVQGVPVTLKALVWNQTGGAVSRYEWDLGDGNWVDGADTRTTTFATNGTYTVGVRVTAGSLTASNKGSVCDDAANFAAQSPSLNPAALPLVVTVVDPPASNWVGPVRPSPFVIGTSASARVDVRMPTGQALTVSVFTLGGVLVRNLISGSSSAGWVVAEWDGRDDKGRLAGEGIYFFQVNAPGLNEKRKFHVVRSQ